MQNNDMEYASDMTTVGTERPVAALNGGGSQVGLEPRAAAARTRPLYEERSLYQLSYWVLPIST